MGSENTSTVWVTWQLLPATQIFSHLKVPWVTWLFFYWVKGTFIKTKQKLHPPCKHPKNWVTWPLLPATRRYIIFEGYLSNPGPLGI